MEENSIKYDLISLRNRFQKEIIRTRRKHEKQKAELQEATGWENYKKTADTILININAIKKGMSSVELTEETNGQKIKIELNTAISPAQNADMYYRKSRKGKRSYGICVEKLKTTQEEITVLEGLLEKVTSFTDDGILTVAKEAEAQAFIDANRLLTAGAAGKKKKKEEHLPFRRYNYKGYDIYVGKTNRDNDELSTKFANPADLWFHAVGYAGSHLIVRRKKNDPMPPDEVLNVAGAIALFFSKAKNCGYTEVHMTEARFVRKPRKSPPGLVVAQRCKTIRVSPLDPQKLFREQKDES